jgi:hypothetical protein
MWGRHRFGPQDSLSGFRDHLLDPIGKGIVTKVGDSEDTLGRFPDIKGMDLELSPRTHLYSRKKGRSQDQGTDSLDSLIDKNPNIL